ncbi:MAG: hypothetical protein JST26_11150 [Bacteroidetes bacterium]|nr:hypothetical protein [Bacteroidota bacterium]
MNINIYKRLLSPALLLCFLFAGSGFRAQILTSSPYSRYGIGEMNTSNFSHLNAMGGSFSAYQCDTAAPYFINIGNPASLSGLKFSTFEVGGQAQFTRIISATDNLKKTNINFSYGSLGVPLKHFGGMAFGIMPYSTVGYKITSFTTDPYIGTVKYVYNGDGGFNRAFLATGIKPFRNRLANFYKSTLYDSLIRHSNYNNIQRLRHIKFRKELLSELSVGVCGNYMFGSSNQTTDAIYPGSITWYNVRRQRQAHISDVSFNAGIQTDFTISKVKEKQKIDIKDSLNNVIGQRDTVVFRTLKHKVKFAFGAYANLPTLLNGTQNDIIYTYSLDGFGNELPLDTVLNSSGIKGTIRIPLEIGGGFSVKKGEKLTVLVDGGVTNWNQFRYFDTRNTFKNSYRVSTGLNYVPNKFAIRGLTYLQRVQYRVGFTYSNGYLDLKNSLISNYAITAGLGLPVGIGLRDDIAVVNLSAQFGTMGTTANSLLKENYIRVIVGFSFNKRWFIKYKYD